MSFKAKYYIVHPYSMIDELAWPENCGSYKCIANIPDMLREVLKIKRIGSEWKLIWNEWHRQQLLKDYNITYQDLEDYLKADCYMISFQTIKAINRAAAALRKMNATGFIIVDSYREVLLKQAHYHRKKRFDDPVPGCTNLPII